MDAGAAEANKVTLKMLANQTSGYPDYETDPKWLAAFIADPFHIWTFEERMKYAFSRPVQFTPGTNWSYSHTNFMILGEILSKIGKKPLDVLLREKVLIPMGLKNTTASQTSEIPSPILHAFDSERRTALKIPADVPFYEESSFWNSQWGTPIGANQTTTIDDMARRRSRSAGGALLSKSSYEAMTGPHLLGFGKKQDNCAPSAARKRTFTTTASGSSLGIVAAAKPDARRLQRDDGVPSVQEDRHRCVRDLRAGSIRRRGELPKFQ
jgi:Beta-lactamase class C and other penicillin binding proteins